MGYHSTLTLDFLFKTDFDKKKLMAKFDKLVNDRKEMQDVKSDYYDLDYFQGAKIVKGYGMELYLEIDDYYGKFSEEGILSLARFFAPYIKKGGAIQVNGEESEDLWQIRFVGKGKYIQENAAIIYGHDSYKEFMEEFSKKMPAELKHKIEEWHGARQI